MPESLSIVPAPRYVEPGDGPGLGLGAGFGLLVGPEPAEIALGVYVARLAERIGIGPVDMLAADDGRDHLVELRLDPAAGPADADPAERYSLVVDGRRALVRAPTVTGLYYGVVTLRQTLRADPLGLVYAPALRVEDAPRFAWRGLSVDVARHFFPVEDIELVVSVMGYYKLNVLHLHLTDDQGWRLDVPSRPGLVERSAGSAVHGARGGYYTSDEYRRIVTFAASRGITVVPEVDVPGHVNAALHAYGELTPSGEPAEAYTGIEVGFSRLDAGLPATRPFLRDVFTDVAAMTPGPYVHVGGDEVLGLDPDEYASLVGLAHDAVRDAGKVVVAWQEAAGVGLAPGSVVQYWDHRTGQADLVAAAAAGCRVLMSPGSRAYLDMKYDADYPRGLEWAGHLDLRDAYDWDPALVVPELPAESVVGVEAAIWTETLATVDELTEMLLPRLTALAEVAWTAPGRRSWDSYRRRIAAHRDYWDLIGVRWYASPQVDW